MTEMSDQIERMKDGGKVNIKRGDKVLGSFSHRIQFYHATKEQKRRC